MAGLSSNTPIPTEIKLHQKSRILELAFENGDHFELTYEFLRVFTPSAEARGHGVGQETLQIGKRHTVGQKQYAFDPVTVHQQIGKRDVDILRIEPVGNYAIKPVFSDGHDSGLYSWDVLHTLCVHRDELWQAYLEKLEAEGASRDASENPPPPAKPAPKCGPAR